MDGRRAGAQLDGIIAVFLHDFRLLQLQFLCARHHDAIAGGFDLLERGLHLVIKLFRLRKFPQHLHERFVIGNLHACLLGQFFIKQRLRQMQFAGDCACP